LNSHICSPSVREVSETVLVSVLDLDNSVRFSRDIHDAARKHRVTYLPPKWNQTEIIATLGKIKQC
jgi:hypothetical protein